MRTAFARARFALRRGGAGALLAGAARQSQRYRQAFVARRAVRSAVGGLASCEDAFDFAYHFYVAGLHIRPAQIKNEITAFCELVRAETPRAVLEIGTDLGGTLLLLCFASAPDARVASIDLPLRGVPTETGHIGYHESRKLVYRAFARDGQRVFPLHADAHDPRTVALVHRRLERPLDVLFIDADKSYDGVSAHFSMYSPLVRPGGLVAFHDIWPGAYAGAVPDFWRTISAGRETLEFVASKDQSAFGIGVLRLP
jgi:predicted O-methyltransferase YrrM